MLYEECPKCHGDGAIPDPRRISGVRRCVECMEKRVIPFRRSAPEVSALLNRLDSNGATGLDLSPGDEDCREAAAAIRALLWGNRDKP